MCDKNVCFPTFVRSRIAGLAGFGLGLGLAAAVPGPAAAQAVQELDSGTFEIRTDGRVVGTESFAIRREGSAVRAVGRIVGEGDGGSVPRTLEVKLQTNAAFRPNAYALRGQGGAVSGVDATWEGDRLRLHVTSVEGERWKEFLTRGPVAVLERGVAHHYHVLFQHLGTDPAGSRVTVIVPSRNQQMTATVSGGTGEAVELGGRQTEARRYQVETDGARATVWLDGQGRVLRVAFPDDRVAVRRP